MNTMCLLMAQYNGQAIISLERVCEDYFRHLPPEKFLRKAMTGETDLPIVRMEGSQKAARGVHLADLALPGCAAPEQVTGAGRSKAS
ncbi:pyocin activator PrtN family protein [Azotobacter salinestris]|uniref:pyocin activator PrtN family protein n=1 Tax=Azotobacter salinestris TaxID=69964 RepID=UPI0032DF37B8